MNFSMSQTGIAVFLARWLLGLIFTMAGWWKVFELTATVHAQRFFVDGFAETWIPEWLLWALGLSIPYLEFGAGLLLLIGFRLKLILGLLGGLLLITTYGHALHEPLFDIDGHTFTRMALILFLLVYGWKDDCTTLDHWFNRRHSSLPDHN